MGLGLLLALAIPLIALLARGSAMIEGKDQSPPESLSTRQKRFRCAAEAANLNPGWTRFLEATASRESKFYPGAHNATVKETAASVRAYEKLGPELRVAIGGTRAQWAQGSKGLFQFLGPYVAVTRGRLRFADMTTEPDMGYDPGVAFAAALSFARGVMARDSFTGTWSGLVVAWGGGSPTTDRLAKATETLERHGEKLGYSSGWANEPVTPLRSYTRNELTALAVALKVAYWGCAT